MIKYFGVEFTKTKYSSVDGKTYVAWTAGDRQDSFQIKVSSAGLIMSGRLEKEIQSQNDLKDLARLITDAWKEHELLAPKILTSLSGH